MMNLSVLNTDFFDRRRWGQILDQSPRLQETVQQGESIFPLYSPLMGDMWASLYKTRPELLEEVDQRLVLNKAMMQRIMEDDAYLKFRDTTKLDDLASAIGSINISEKVREWIEKQRQENERLNEMLQQVLEQQQGQDGEQGEGTGSQESNELMQALQQMLQDMMGDSSFSKALKQAATETQSQQDGLKSLLSGIQAGDQQGDLKKVPLREKLALAEKLKYNPKLKSIMEWAGRFKAIAQKKQRNKHTETVIRSGITVGNDLERTLPMELAMLKNPTTKSDFYRRFSEGQIMQYAVKGKEVLGKGPIILCLDQSSSMEKLDNQSKGFMLAMMAIARKQKRDFAYIPFDTTAPKTHLFEKGKMSINKMLELSEEFLNGGTNFKPPLQKVLEVVKTSRFKNADIVFVTDGESTYDRWYETEFAREKKELEFNVLSILLGTEKVKTVELFSDKIIKAKHFMDEPALAALEI